VGEMRQVPVSMPTDELADLLEQMANAVRCGDSLEGFLNYLLPDPEDDDAPEGRYHMVEARIRTGNQAGQGGMIMIGQLREVQSVPDDALPDADERALQRGLDETG